MQVKFIPGHDMSGQVTVTLSFEALLEPLFRTIVENTDRYALNEENESPQISDVEWDGEEIVLTIDTTVVNSEDPEETEIDDNCLFRN